jgi:hypothetical protein
LEGKPKCKHLDPPSGATDGQTLETQVENFRTYVVARTGRTARRGDKDELVFHRLLLARGQRLCENGFRGGNVGSLLLRVRSLFESFVVGSDLVLVLIPRTGRCFLGGRSEASINVRTGESIRNKTTRCAKENLRRVDPELWKGFPLCSRRRTAAQRQGGDRAVDIIT